MVPDIRALRDLESLWRRWQAGTLVYGETPWRDVFGLLRALRPWGAEDRVRADEASILEDVIHGLDEDELVSIEVELVYRRNPETAAHQVQELTLAVGAGGGQVLTSARIEEIAYHALLVQLPVAAIRQIAERSTLSIAGLESVMHIRPQSVASSLDVEDAGEAGEAALAEELGAPILAMLDGVPVAAHSLLVSHIELEDHFGLEPQTPVVERNHGTAMASLIVHGDRNRVQVALPRRIHVVPVLGPHDNFPADRLIVDLIYQAVLAMREGNDATAPDVVIVNLSLGNMRRRFHGVVSPWARLLDRLAYRFGLLFIVSAGNCTEQFDLPAFATHGQFEDAEDETRAVETLRALGQLMADRRIFSPGETVNGLTIGACNQDAVSNADRAAARVNVDPYGALTMVNPSSALGPGFASAVKPDLLMPGAREHLRFVRNDVHIEVQPASASRSAGMRVASPPRGGRENQDGFTNGTSAAAAIASRTAHQIYDALELNYGDDFLRLDHLEKATLLKALLAHPAKWPVDAAQMIRRVLGPTDPRQHVRVKDNIRRFLGFGVVDGEDAVACASDRATFWATGRLGRDKMAKIDVPIPAVMSGKARLHSMSATLAWLTPTSPGRASYRTVRLKLLEPTDLAALAVKASSVQPDANQTNRGTLFSRIWEGDRAPAVGPDFSVSLVVQRDPDQGATVDDEVPFAVAVTIAMPGVVEIYDQVRQRLDVITRAIV